jgi:hypothetical protein
MVLNNVVTEGTNWGLVLTKEIVNTQNKGHKDK